MSVNTYKAGVAYTMLLVSFSAAMAFIISCNHDLHVGCRWCLCSGRWKQAEREGHAPKVDLEATDEAALRDVDIELLKKYAGN